jgi:tetratricopeptide (TPR) repeat protein
MIRWERFVQFPGMTIQRFPNGVLIMVAVALAAGVGPFAKGITPADKTLGDINRRLAQGRLEVRQKKFDQAILTFSAALQMNPDPKTAAEIYGERGGTYVDKADLNKAMADGEAAVRLAPGYFRGYQVRGRVYRNQKKLDSALAEFEKALQLAPAFAQLYNNRGNVFTDKEQPERAIKDFSEAISHDPQSLDGYVNRGGSYLSIGEFDKAIIDLNHALRIDPRDSDSYYNRGLAHQGKQDYGAAVSDFSRANELSPHDPVMLNSMAWLKATCRLDAVRNGKEALKASLEACQLTGFKNSDNLDTLAAACAESGDFDRAVEYATKTLERETNPGERKDVQKRLALYRDHKPYRDLQPLKWLRPRHG